MTQTRQFKANVSGGEYERELVPEGVTLGRCIGIVDIGTQHNEFYDKWQRKIMWFFELPEYMVEREVDGEKGTFPIIRSTEMTNVIGGNSAKQSNMERFLRSWLGGEYASFAETMDLGMLLDRPAQINIVHQVSNSNKKTYDNVGGIMQVPKGMLASVVPTITNPFIFCIDWFIDDGFFPGFDDTLPKWAGWVAKKIEASAEWPKLQAAMGDPQAVFSKNKVAKRAWDLFVDTNSQVSTGPASVKDFCAAAALFMESESTLPGDLLQYPDASWVKVQCNIENWVKENVVPF